MKAEQVEALRNGTLVEATVEGDEDHQEMAALVRMSEVRAGMIVGVREEVRRV